MFPTEESRSSASLDAPVGPALPHQASPQVESEKPLAQILEAVKSFDETAKQIITIEPILTGLYFGAFTITKLNIGPSWQLLVYLAPLALFVVSLLSALMVFFPAGYVKLAEEHSPQRTAYMEVVRHKLLWFRAASIFFVLGIVGVFFALMTYLLR